MVVTSKSQFKGGRLLPTHACWEHTGTHLGFLLSGNFLIGSLAESLLSESSVRTIRTSSDFSVNKKASPSTWTRTVYPRLVWKTSFAWFFSPKSCENFSLVFHYQWATHSSDTSGWQNSTENTACFMRQSLWSKNENTSSLFIRKLMTRVRPS